MVKRGKRPNTARNPKSDSKGRSGGVSAKDGTKSAQPSLKQAPSKGEAPNTERPLSVVGVGASAGGLEAFEQLLRALPADTGMAFCLVQHLAPRHESILSELLGKATKMPVVEVSEGMQVHGDHVYVIPPNAD